MWWKDADCGADSPRGTACEAATYVRRGEAGKKLVLRSLYSFRWIDDQSKMNGFRTNKVGNDIQFFSAQT